MQTLRFTPLALLVATGLSLSACQEKEAIEVKEHVSGEVLEQIQAHGYSTVGVQKIADGYIVEGDIMLSSADLVSQPKAPQVGADENYWSGLKVGKPANNTVRTIRVKLEKSRLGSSKIDYDKALQQAVDKYNGAKYRLDLYIDFKKVNPNESADITIRKKTLPNGGGVSQFPSNNNPGAGIIIDVQQIDNADNNPKYRNTVEGLSNLLAHEMGHAIGFRHTDPNGTSKATCGNRVNKGFEGNDVEQPFGKTRYIDIKYIPNTLGTDVGQSTNSWMLACMPFNVARGPFIKEDERALSYLYKRLK